MVDPANQTKPSRTNRALEFVAGFLGIVLANLGLFGLGLLIFQLSLPSELYGPIFSGYGFLILLLNLGGLIFLAFKWPRAALGVLSAYAALFIVVLCVGVLITAICFSGGSPTL